MVQLTLKARLRPCCGHEAACTAARITACPAPLQALLASSHLYHEVQKNAASHGVIVDGARIDIGKMMAQKDKAVSGLTKGVEGLFKKYKARRLSLQAHNLFAVVGAFCLCTLWCDLGQVLDEHAIFKCRNLSHGCQTEDCTEHLSRCSMSHSVFGGCHGANSSVQGSSAAGI